MFAGSAATVASVAAGAAGVASSAMNMANSGAGKAGGAANAGYADAKHFLIQGALEANKKLEPYADVGGQGLNELAWQMGLNPADKNYVGVGERGNLQRDFSMQDYRNDPGYTPMVNSLEELQATPGYQFQLNQGLQSVNNSAAARGSLLSGNQIKAVNDYAQGVASTGYQQAWDRAQQAYQNAYNRFTTNQSNRYGRLQSMANNGQQAATQQGNNSLAVGQALAGVAANQGATNASLALYQGQQNQAGRTNIANSLTSLLSNPSIQSGIGSWFGGSGGGTVGGINMNNSSLANLGSFAGF